MIAGFKPYTDYKESRLRCLGLIAMSEGICADIPHVETAVEGWSETCLKGVCHE